MAATGQNQKRISDFVNIRVWAVVGASRARHKFGYRVYRSMLQSGYVVYPVNPSGGELDGATVYSSLAHLPERPEVADTVVPPHVTEEIVREMHALGLKRVWMQPGSESKFAMDFCHDHGIEVVHGACAMVHKRRWTEST
jgi:predicted CoA-binding protein